MVVRARNRTDCSVAGVGVKRENFHDKRRCRRCGFRDLDRVRFRIFTFSDLVVLGVSKVLDRSRPMFVGTCRVRVLGVSVAVA